MRREFKSSNFLAFIFPLLIFLFIRDIQARKLQQTLCSSSCGSINNISYPFRLKGDPAGCGDPDFELSCQTNKTILEFHSGKYYYVKRILYAQHLISLADVNLANGSCGLPHDSLSRKEIYSYTSTLSDNPTPYTIYNSPFSRANFVRCSSEIRDPTYRILPCLNIGNHSYFYVNYDGYSMSDLQKSCSFISSVPINRPSVEYPSYEDIQRLLQSGFDLLWSVECRDCKSAGGYCDYNYSPGGIYSHRCRHGSSSEWTSYIILSTILSLLASFLLRMFSSLPEILFLLCSYYPRLLLRFYYLVFDPIYVYIYEHFINASLHDYPLLIDLLLDVFLFGVFEVILIAKLILVMVLVVFLIHKYRTTKKTVDNIEKFLCNRQSWMPKRYSFIEIIAITNHFRDKLGQGGFGSVYKGQLLSGRLIAVKVLENSKFSGEEFINEVSTIGRIHHTNVVRLLGFCSEGSKRALVYEYMPNSSLDRHIFSKNGNVQAFSWEKLHEIALGTTRGIDYLHNGCDVCILHFDIKPHNILLDHNFIPKVADFGLAKFYPKENDFICVSATRGTIGYIAPELISRNFGVVSCKSDIYSFGMLLLEMAGGRRNSFANATRSSKAYFPSWAYDQMIKGRDLEFQTVNEIEGVIARKLCIIGLWCIQVKATDRPSITKVVEMLEGSIGDLKMPSRPFFSSSPSSSHQKSCIREIQSDSWTESLESESIEECSV